MSIVDDINDLLDPTDEAIIYAYADNRMRVIRTAKNAHYDKRTVHSRLTNIRLKTGIDPRDFWGLHRLISIIENAKEGSNE